MPKRYAAPIVGANTAAVLTLPAPSANLTWLISNINCSYNVAPATPQLLTITDGTLTENHYVTAAGLAPIVINGTYKPGAAVVLTLAAATGCTGALSCSADPVYG